MSQHTFQSALARLIVDPDFRDRVRSIGATALTDDLNERERWRLLAAAGDKGLDITRTLYKGFRLSKLLTTLPYTCTLLGEKCLAEEVGRFWAGRLAMSFYYLEEAFAFCDYLRLRLRAGLAIDYLEEVIGYERAGLELQRPSLNGTPPPPQEIVFRHDPLRLLTPLAAGERPEVVPERPCLVVGRLASGGGLQWTIREEGSDGEVSWFCSRSVTGDIDVTAH